MLLTMLIGCKSKESSAPTSQSLIEQAKQAAQQALSNATIPESEQQLVIPPQSQQVQSPQTTMQGSDVIDKNYIAPCTLQKYKVLNTYCKGKTFWVKQSTLTSWYVPYSLVLFALAVITIYFIIKLMNRN